MPERTLYPPATDVSVEQAQAELENVLRSPSFERSERLKRFLRCICEMTLQGEASRINEYLLGLEVFQRGPDYSPNDDSVVRRQAHTLRHKLQEYYAGEGKTHEVRIELPVGRYVPAFRRNAEAVPAAAPIVQETGEVPVAPQRRTLGLAVAGAALLVVFAAAGGWFVGSGSAGGERGRSKLSPVMLEIWGPWLQSQSETVICFSNPMTAVIKHFPGPLPPGTIPHRQRANPEEEKLFADAFNVPPGGAYYLTPANQAKMGEAIAAVYLTRLLAGAGHGVHTTQSRFLSWEDLARDDLVLLGHNEANRWLDPLLEKYPFGLAATVVGAPRSIVNRKPGAGEQPEYHIAYSGSESEADEEYALVSMLPGVSAGHPLLLINGLNTQATQMATQYLTSENTVRTLVQRLHQAQPDHRGPMVFPAGIENRGLRQGPHASHIRHSPRTLMY